MAFFFFYTAPYQNLEAWTLNFEPRGEALEIFGLS